MDPETARELASLRARKRELLREISREYAIDSPDDPNRDPTPGEVESFLRDRYPERWEEFQRLDEDIMILEAETSPVEHTLARLLELTGVADTDG